MVDIFIFKKMYYICSNELSLTDRLFKSANKNNRLGMFLWENFSSLCSSTSDLKFHSGSTFKVGSLTTDLERSDLFTKMPFWNFHGLKNHFLVSRLGICIIDFKKFILFTKMPLHVF